MVPFDHKLYNEKATGINYPEFYKVAIVENMERNQVIVDEVLDLLKQGHPTIVIVRAIDHGHILKEMLINSGVRTEFIWGDVDAMERIAIRNEFNNGAYDVLIGSTIFDTAIDLHRASGLVLAASGSSKIRAPQRVGRVLSQVMGKKAFVKDIKDINVKYFADDAKDRQKVYVARYGDKRIKVRGAGPKSDVEKILGIDYSQMFDNIL
jgi:superfamily II DNA or RNA helicase